MDRPPTAEPARSAHTTVLFDVWLIMHSVIGQLDLALAETGLSADDFGLYSLLAGFGPATPTQLARWTGMRPTTLSAALKRIANRGDIDRLPNPEDARSYLVSLNERGWTKHRAAQPAFRGVLQQLALTLGPAEREVRLSLQRLDASLREVARLDARPYSVEASAEPSVDADAEKWQLTYGGAPLTHEEEADVLRYVDWIRERRRRS